MASARSLTEPGFGSAVIVLVALFVLFLIVSGWWRQADLAWQELWDINRLTAPPGKSGFQPSGSFQFTPGVDAMSFAMKAT